jgi:polyribonucleotide nucleotidyltransferase
MIHTTSFEVGGFELSIETGRVAKQANGSVLLGMGETIVLATATMSNDPREGLDFFPLVCDYEERKYAVGKIPGGFNKRGGRPSEKAILTSRLIDRSIRPLFPKGMRNDVQCIAIPLSVDQDYPPDVLAVNAVSAALMISDIPWEGPIGCVRVGLENDEFVLLPNVERAESGNLDLIVAGTKDKIIMVECGAIEVPDETVVNAMRFAQDSIKLICDRLEEFKNIAGKEKREVALFSVDEEIKQIIRNESGAEIEETIQNPDKASRESALSDLLKSLVEKYATTTFAEDDAKKAQLPEAADTVIKEKVRELIINKNLRPDGRGPKDIRTITIEPGLLPRVHGSGIFTRGQTQVLTVCTLGAPGESQILDGLEEVDDKRYMHFYNFPPYSVGEVRPLRGPGRREIGHGALAERALKGVLPSEDEFPYTILLMSEVLESNGSTSMASACGSTIALLDCGVPIKKPVAGIAMGLMTDGDKSVVLTDIQGMEDFCGDMDFKVAGTREGVTALQLDCKIKGVPFDVLKNAIHEALGARLFILDKIDEAIPERRKDLNPNAPRISVINIDPQKIGEVIGPSGKMIKRITAETGSEISIEQDGRVFILAKDTNSIEQAKRWILGMTKQPEVGDEFTGPVTRMFAKGVMVEFLPGKEGMVPIEHLSAKSIRRPEDAVQPGDIINVQVLDIDQMGRINLTALGLKQELPSLEENVNASPKAVVRTPSSGGRGERGGGRFDRDRDRDRGRRDDNRRSPRSDDRRSERTTEQTPEAHFRPRGDSSFPKKEQPAETKEPGGGARFRPKR